MLRCKSPCIRKLLFAAEGQWYASVSRCTHAERSWIGKCIERILQKCLASYLFKTGMQIANDVAEGHPFKDASLKHIPDGIKAFVSSSAFKPQSGSGQKRRKQPLKKRGKRFKYDIFDKEDEEKEKEEEE